MVVSWATAGAGTLEDQGQGLRALGAFGGFRVVGLMALGV